jgi:hypothetical protein
MAMVFTQLLNQNIQVLGEHSNLPVPQKINYAHSFSYSKYTGTRSTQQEISFDFIPCKFDAQRSGASPIPTSYEDR